MCSIWNLIQKHYNVVKEVLGDDCFVIECHEDVFIFLQKLFYPCTAVEGGLTLLQTFHDWLDLRFSSIKYRNWKSGRVLLARLYLKIAYNHPESIDFEETKQACELFKQIVDILGVRFESCKLSSFEFKLSDEEIEKQLQKMNEFKEKIRELFNKVIELGKLYEVEFKNLVNELRNELCKVSKTACNSLNKFKYLRNDKNFFDTMVHVVNILDSLKLVRDDFTRRLYEWKLEKYVRYFTKSGIEVIEKYWDRIKKVESLELAYREMNYVKYLLECLDGKFIGCDGLIYEVKKIEHLLKQL